MRILITGASGLIGKELTVSLNQGGHEVIPLVRRREQKGIYWNPEQNEIDLPAMEGAEALIHLAGEGIAAHRWTESFKKKILDSRIQGTNLLAQSFHKLKSAPRKFLSASAVGYYADGGSSKITEGSLPDNSFLSKVCEAWEKASRQAPSNVPVINFRIGVVLSNKGGALEKMLTPFKMGVGGKVGNGQQFMPWIDIRDLCGALLFLLEKSEAGIYNLSSPNPVTQEEFAKCLSKVLNRPNFVHTPKWLVKTALGGEMAEELLLKSLRVYPENLMNAGFKFQHENLESSLRHWVK